jgi:dihydropteroate synthase
MNINCLGTLIDVSKPKIMGILNLTPNSFYDGGIVTSNDEILAKVDQMIKDGADFIDIGAYSSKPNAAFVSEAEEMERLLPKLKLIIEHFPSTLISIDTFRSKVAKAAIDFGACMVNDISAGSLDVNMMPTISELKVPYIMMHMKGTPQTMTSLAQYEDVVYDVLFYFSGKLKEAQSLGINDIIIDPGFGFAKTLEHNFEMMQKLELFTSLEVPMLVGISRKSMIYKSLECTANEALNGTTALHMVSLQKGANILRVHDVKEAVECVKLYNLMNTI